MIIPLRWLLLTEMVLATPGWAEEPVRLEAVQVYPSPTGSRIVLESTGPLAVVTYTLPNPDRLIVDPIESRLTTAVLAARSLPAAGLVMGWEVVTSRGQVDYLVFPVALPSQATVYQAGRLLTVEVTPTVAGHQPPAVSDQPPEEPPRPPSVPDTQAVSGTPQAEAVPDTELTPEQAIQKGLAVHEPSRIALEETEVAMLKVKEARRNLFPGASLRGTQTNGTAAGADFREAQYGLQVEHPLYDGGRLRDTYKQALINLQLAQKRYEKSRADFAFEVAQAYFELLAAQQTVAVRQQAVAETERLHGVTSKRFAAGLVTRMELLNVESQRSQAQFQLAGARNDVAIAELKFRHRLRWPETLPVTLPQAFPATNPTVEVAELLRVAALNRPDIQINTLLVEFHRFEEQLAKKKGAWKLDLTGFLGQSGGAFETEPLNLDTDYSLALRLSKPWGGHTGSVTYTTVETAPRVGQTTRTDSTSLQGELNILNALAGKTEIKQANVGKLKAEQDLSETRRLMEQEVYEAFYAYQKAALTLQHAQQKEQFRREQVKILTAQAGLNEVLPSQILEAQLQLADDQASQVQARASHHVALARLNKAIGVASYY